MFNKIQSHLSQFNWEISSGMKKIIPFLLLIFLLTGNLYAIDTVSTKYLPLKVGNSWTYQYAEMVPWNIRWRIKIIITGTTIINNHLYYNMYEIRTNNYNQSYQLRIDSITGNLLQRTTSQGCSWLQNDILLDSMASHLNDSCSSQCTLRVKCYDTLLVSIFGLSKQSKSFQWSPFELWSQTKYVKDIGISNIYTGGGQPGSNSYQILVGCYINGIKYGDTSLTGITPISNEIPESFSLSQNYPNPFNPSTVISFQLVVSSNTKLIVYDILSNEVSTLVNEQLKPGTYEVEWNGSNYSSGVYYYKLIAGDYTETRKMLMIK